MLSSQPTSRIRIDFTLIEILSVVSRVHTFRHIPQGFGKVPYIFLFFKKLLKFKYLPDPWRLLRDGYPDIPAVLPAVATSIFHSVGVRVAAIAVCVVSLLAEAAIFKLCFVHFICPLEWRLVFSINFID